MKTPELSIVMINYNTPDLVQDSLRTIAKYVRLNYEVIVVDNGSGDKSKIDSVKLRKLLPPEKIKVIFSKTNLGFGKGNNLGAKDAKGKYLWFLNSDTLLTDDSPSKMVSFLDKHPKIGALSPLLYHEDGIIQKNFFASFQNLGSVTIRRYNDHKIDFSKEYFTADIVVGAAMMLERKKFEDVGGFDRNIFMYLEDDDLCKRLSDVGYQNAVLNSAKIIHLEGRSIKTSSARKKYYYRSQTYFWYKHNGRLATLIMRIIRWPYKLFKTL
ncbi:MAG: glycosyltransferase family 2 protein [Patescibacteria group bacterium]|jgi:hypothetical protein